MPTTITFIDPFLEMSDDRFLVGPDGDEDALDVDDVFGKDFDDLMAEMREYDPKGLDIAAGAFRRSSLVDPDYSFVDVEAGVLLLDQDGNSVGAYVSCDVSVDFDAQGQGLGAELILERLICDGGLPVWELDAPSYSSAGRNAHVSALRLARGDKAGTDLRLARRVAHEVLVGDPDAASAAADRGFDSVEALVVDAIARLGREGAEREVDAAFGPAVPLP